MFRSNELIIARENGCFLVPVSCACGDELRRRRRISVGRWCLGVLYGGELDVMGLSTRDREPIVLRVGRLVRKARVHGLRGVKIGRVNGRDRRRRTIIFRHRWISLGGRIEGINGAAFDRNFVSRAWHEGNRMVKTGGSGGVKSLGLVGVTRQRRRINRLRTVRALITVAWLIRRGSRPGRPAGLTRCLPDPQIRTTLWLHRLATFALEIRSLEARLTRRKIYRALVIFSLIHLPWHVTTVPT